ncbi:hypothetical protein E2C01_023287 [Portunus trituberculatus]|uniref:Uncharacterized protein n=1 Tax=Portunus trituberculatus TaxID=210409 RepID=A0A5B7EAR0_PORTR|nr:hypothetical protein [Portunus trituberculatus]
MGLKEEQEMKLGHGVPLLGFQVQLPSAGCQKLRRKCKHGCLCLVISVADALTAGFIILWFLGFLCGLLSNAQTTAPATMVENSTTGVFQ